MQEKDYIFKEVVHWDQAPEGVSDGFISGAMLSENYCSFQLS